jgi:hypothetical protein
VQTGDEGVRGLPWLSLSFDVPVDQGKGPSERPVQWAHPPPLIAAADCPLYLRHLSLLI